MASLERRNDCYRIVFRHLGKKYGFSTDTTNRSIAEALRGGIDKTLMLMNQGLLRVPENADVLEFVRTGGVHTEPPKPPPEKMTLGKLRDAYLENVR